DAELHLTLQDIPRFVELIMDMARRPQRTGGRSTLDDGEASVIGAVDLDSSGTRRPLDRRPSPGRTIKGSEPGANPIGHSSRRKHADQTGEPGPVRHGRE